MEISRYHDLTASERWAARAALNATPRKFACIVAATVAVGVIRLWTQHTTGDLLLLVAVPVLGWERQGFRKLIARYEDDLDQRSTR